jgi:thiamine-monophosphate kinase
MKLCDLGEDAFLEELQKRLPPSAPPVRIGIGDDAAALDLPAGESILVSSDSLVEGVHFTARSLPPRFIGRKAVAVNASDIAAMGGRPVAVLASLAARRDAEVDALLDLLMGLAGRAGELGASLVGGNLAASPGPLVVDVTILGVSQGRRVLTRKGAALGDGLFVSGRLGASAEGRRLIKERSGAGPGTIPSGSLTPAEECLRRHMDPEPRLELGAFLCRSGAATSCIDISDGLARDLARLCRASAVGAVLEEAALPIHEGVRVGEGEAGREPLASALAGGEDYELLFTVPDPRRLQDWENPDVALTRIGAVAESGSGIRLRARDGSERVLAAEGWDHFARSGLPAVSE